MVLSISTTVLILSRGGVGCSSQKTAIDRIQHPTDIKDRYCKIIELEHLLIYEAHIISTPLYLPIGPPMYLTKRCRKKDNIINGTIKLGSLYEYRKTESTQILDRNEGTKTFHMKFEGTVKVPIDWFNTLNGIFSIGGTPTERLPGKVSVSGGPLCVVDKDSEFVTLRDSSLTIEREALNGFIYCMSLVENPTDCEDIFTDYDDYWYMSHEHVEKFASRLCDVLLESIINRHDNGTYIIPKSINPRELHIYCRIGKVMYSPREIIITSHSDFSYDDFLSNLSTMTFLKPAAPFEPEKEFRFEFTLAHKGLIIVPEVEKLIIDSSQLIEYVA